MSEIDWKRPLARGTRIPLAPVHFRGKLRSFLDEVLEPALPRPQVVIAWHEAVIAHALKPDETLLVRSTSGFKQEDETRTTLGRRLRMTDNAPPWWIHAVAFSGTYPPAAGLSEVLEDVWCWMFRAGSRAGAGTNASDAGWYVAHILRAKPDGDGPPERWDEATARRRFIRNLSPMNQFLVPKGNGSDVGERSTVIATIADWYKARYGAVFTDFLQAAGVRPGELGPPDWDLVVELVGTSSEVESSPPRPTEAPRATTRTAVPAGPLSSFWRKVLERKDSTNRRAEILGAAPDARERLARLVDGLTVEQFVGVANAVYNRCDPPDVEAAAPGDARRQARLAWGYLEDARANPRLGGKWASTVAALRPGGSAGVDALAALGLNAFVTAALRVESQVYRKV